jgi:transposase
MASSIPTQQLGWVFGGIDTHKDTHTAALVDSAGMLLGSAVFPTTQAGYRQLLGWMGSAGTLARVGVEGTGSYGAGICHRLSAEGIEVVEVNRPDRSQRRRRGKSDALDAAAAAEAARTRQRIAVPKSRDGQVESLRVLKVTRASAVKARTIAFQELDQLLVTAPAQLRDQTRDLSKMKLIRSCAEWRPNPANAADPLTATRIAVRRLARRYLALSVEIAEFDELLTRLVAEVAPQLLATVGVGAETAGQLLITAGDNPDRVHSEAAFAMLCGVAPLPASSGKTQRHRLNRGGDRQANRALHVIAKTRTRCDPPTQAYMNKKTAEKHHPGSHPQPQTPHRPRGLLPAPPDTSHATGSSIPARQPARRRGQGGAPHARNDLDRAEHRHTIKNGGTGPLTNREASLRGMVTLCTACTPSTSVDIPRSVGCSR